MVKLLLRLCGIERISPEIVVLDHLPIQAPVEVEVRGERVTTATRRVEKLAAARERLGRAFKCAARSQDREVLVAPGVVSVVGAGLNRKDVRIVIDEASRFDRAAWDSLKVSQPVVAIESRRRR